jgi:hypothetical protein
MAKPLRGAAREVLQLKITLRHVEPPVWRRVLVPSTTTLGKLHFVLNEAMGWANSHLHSFTVGDRTFGDTRMDDVGELGFEDERQVRLTSLVTPGQALVYEYDFGDSWEHDVVFEASLQEDPRVHYPICIAGARACPPEDCGGVPGYEGMLESLADAESEEHHEILTWVGGLFDPEGFDLNRTNHAPWRLKR